MSDVKALIARLRNIDGQSLADLQMTMEAAADALEASVQAPAVDREALILSLANDECWEKDGAGGWEFVPALGADRLFASGILLDAAEVEARGLEKAADIADSIGHVNNNQHSHIAWEAAEAIRARAQQVREGNA